MSSEDGMPDGAADVRAQVRGSVLLTGGRIFATALNMGVQVLTVRALTQSGYAAFAYGLVVAGVGELLSVTGMHRAIVILLPRHETAGDVRAAMATLTAAALSVVGVGLAFVLAVFSFRALIAGSLADDPQAIVVLTLLAFLGPIKGAETLFDSTYAALGRPRAIVLRQYLLAPLLRLAAVVLVLLGPSNPVLLAFGYVLGGLLGLAVAGQGLRRILRAHDLFRGARLGIRGLPVKLTALTTLPLFANNLVELALQTLDVVMLVQLSTPEQVALLRAIMPVARANEFVVTGFTVLFTPMAARLLARRREAELNRLYWQTALWRAVLAFPILMLCTVLASPVTVLLFGERYADSAPMLTVIGAGVYVGALAGPNQAVLEVTSRFRQLLAVNIVTVALLIVLNLLLIPTMGGLGAALATGGALVFRGAATQVLVLLHGSIGLPGREFRRPYQALFTALAATGVVLLVQPGPLTSLLVAAALSVGVLIPARQELDVISNFPALARVPGLPLLLGHRAERSTGEDPS
ncbi:lipopolysaccharide biosynthesis protein [Egicoccus sp. AB-alg2]|uniref:lipopolysaccharide biosynthesis protein n=1 Tax=Egicoccus sp. AB-alg2 TaxID=3242693 RepID=UPI00359D92F0